MNAQLPLFVLRDTRQQSGELREIARFVDPAEATIARDLLRAAGDAGATVEIVEAVDVLRLPRE